MRWEVRRYPPDAPSDIFSTVLSCHTTKKSAEDTALKLQKDELQGLLTQLPPENPEEAYYQTLGKVALIYRRGVIRVVDRPLLAAIAVTEPDILHEEDCMFYSEPNDMIDENDCDCMHRCAGRYRDDAGIRPMFYTEKDIAMRHPTRA